MANCTGLGASFAYTGTSAWAGRIRSIGAMREFVEILDNTALDSTDYRQSCPDELKDIDPIEMEFYTDDGKPRPPIGEVGSGVLTFAPGGSGAASMTGSGFFSEWSTSEQTPGTRTIATVQWKFDGETGPTWADGS